jgi:hypothetical protein
MTVRDIELAWETWEQQQPSGERQLTRWAFRFLTRAEAPTIPACAAALGLPVELVRCQWKRMAASGTATVTGDWITGTGGLSIAPTAHGLCLNGLGLYAWCALDTLGIPAALHADAVVTAPVAPTGETVPLTLRHGRLEPVPSDLHLELIPPKAARSLCGET